MEKKKSYCPSCGNKTNDNTCEICSRKTKPISERYREKNLYIVEDDVVRDDEQQLYRDNKKEKNKEKNKASKRNEENYAQESQHPRFEHPQFVHPDFKKPQFEHPKMKLERSRQQRDTHIYEEQGASTNSVSGVWGKVIGIAIVFIIFGFVFFLFMSIDEEKKEETSTYEELAESAQFEDAEDRIATCEAYVDEGENYLQVSAVGDTAVDGYLNDRDETYVMLLPGQKLYLDQMDGDGGGCPLTVNQKITLDIEKPTRLYSQFTYDDRLNDRVSDVYVEDDLTDSEYEEISDYILAWGIFQNIGGQEQLNFRSTNDPDKYYLTVTLNYDDESVN